MLDLLEVLDLLELLCLLRVLVLLEMLCLLEMYAALYWVTPKRRPCRLQIVQTMQTVQTVQTEYFFSNTFSLFSVLRLQNSVKYVVMFVIYPQTAQTRRLTVDSIDKRV